VEVNYRGYAGDVVEVTGNHIFDIDIAFNVNGGADARIYDNTFESVGTLGPSGVS
jgi:hypothetical protein